MQWYFMYSLFYRHQEKVGWMKRAKWRPNTCIWMNLQSVTHLSTRLVFFPKIRSLCSLLPTKCWFLSFFFLIFYALLRRQHHWLLSNLVFFWTSQKYCQNPTQWQSGVETPSVLWRSSLPAHLLLPPPWPPGLAWPSNACRYQDPGAGEPPPSLVPPKKTKKTFHFSCNYYMWLWPVLLASVDICSTLHGCSQAGVSSWGG